jgi:dipeptidyl aminopeptidase/acylaminoacyl peptidase
MTRRTKINGWMALPLVLLAAGGLLWHVLACVESPMSFSPTGDLAFTTMEPYDGEHLILRGTHVYRLMVLPAGASEPKVLEESVDWMISAPAFSPDGKRIAYVRLPLLMPEEFARINRVYADSRKARESTAKPVEYDWPTIPAAPPPEPAQAGRSQNPTEAIAMPFWGATLDYSVVAPCMPTVPAQLVERDAATGAVLSLTGVAFPLVMGESKEDDEGFCWVMRITYVLSRLQYRPDGQAVLLCIGSPMGSFTWAVDPSGKTQSLVTGQAAIGVLSPDGKMLAAACPACLGFVRMDGSLTSYVRWERGASPGGMVWVDKETVAVLGEAKVNDQKVQQLSFVKANGTVTKRLTLPDMEIADEYEDTGQLALSPGGRSIVVSLDKATYFLNGSGKLLSAYEGDDEKGYLAQPIFSPNGREVALKVMKAAEGESRRVAEIAFFSPSGKELRRVAVPPSTAPLTRPASPPPVTSPSGAQADDF